MPIRVDGVLDIETENWDKFVLGGLLHADGNYEEYAWRDEHKLVDRLLRIGGHVWTWNGGLFDTLWLLQRLRRQGYRVDCTMAGTRVIRLCCEGLIVHDGAALVPMSLQKAARIAGIQLSKNTGLPCRCGSACDGYCSIKRDMPQSELLSLSRYLREDCEATLATMNAIVTESNRCGYQLGATVGGTSYKTASTMLGIEPAQWEWPLYKFARQSYYGGRVEVFRPTAPAGHAYDINSAYPAALVRIDLPTGPCMLVRGDRAVKAYKRERPGSYMARVHVPRTMHVPPLPTRTPAGRVVFPTGTFLGVWTLLELSRAQELGATVDVHRALVFLDSERVLAPFMRHVWDCRERARIEDNQSLATWHKWVANSCTGKFAEEPSKERVVVNPKPEQVRRCQCGKGKKWCRCNAWRPLDMDGEVWSAPFWRLSANAHVHWAAYLTASARVSLLNQLLADGQGGRTAIYCDTDSCYATIPRSHDIGPELGQWKYEGPIAGWQALAPKLYRYERDGRVVVRGKGLPGLDAAGFESFARGEPVTVQRGVMGLKSAARSGELFQRKRLSRRNRADGRFFGGRELGRDGVTHPRTFMEILKWEKS